jgi:hypothetical protein
MGAFWLACLLWGGGPERASAHALMAMFTVDRVYHLFVGAGVGWWNGSFHFLLDAGTCVALVSIALVANRKYTLWIGSLQVLALNAHLARMLITDPTSVAYAINYIMPSYLQMIALAGGLLAHRNRLHRFGKYRSWRRHWPALLERMRPNSP